MILHSVYFYLKENTPAYDAFVDKFKQYFERIRVYDSRIG